MDSIQDALRPIQTVLKDIGRALNLGVHIDVQGRAEERLQAFIVQLQKLLRDATENLVHFQADGSWVFEREVAIAINEEEPVAAEQSDESFESRPEQVKKEVKRKYLLKVQGYRADGKDELSVTVHDLGNRTAELIAKGTVVSPREIDFSFYPHAIERLLENKVISVDLSEHRNVQANVLANVLGECELRIRKAEQSIHCKDLKIRIDSFMAEINSLDFSHDSDGIDLSASAVLKDASKTAVAEVKLEGHPNQKTKIEAKLLKKAP